MRIGIDVKCLSDSRFTGISVYVYEMIKNWNDFGTHNEFFLFSNKEFDLDFELASNWKIVICKGRFKSVWVQINLPFLLKKYHIDVFWQPFHFLPYKISNVKYICTIHDIAAYAKPKLCALKNVVQHKLLLKLSCKRADLILAISEATKRDIINFLGINEDKIKVIYNGGSPYHYDKLTNDDLSHNDICHINSPYFLFVGTIEPRKNVTSIIRAFNIYKNKQGNSSLLVIAGKTGWKCKNILKEINESPYKEDIIITGYISDEDKEILYRNAKALLFPSILEGFGLPIVEAMSVGLPVITTNNSSMSEVGGDVAFYIEDPFDIEGLSEKMISIDSLSNEQRVLISNRSMNRCMMFSHKNCARLTYDSIIALCNKDCI